jgi:hypothetical protein
MKRLFCQVPLLIYEWRFSEICWFHRFTPTLFVVRDLSAVFSFAIQSEILPRNPCESAAVRKTDNRNERFLTLDIGVSALCRSRQATAHPKSPIVLKWTGSHFYYLRLIGELSETAACRRFMRRARPSKSVAL